MTSASDQPGTFRLNGAGKLTVLAANLMSGFSITALVPLLPAISESFKDIPQAEFLVRSLVGVVSLAMLVGGPCVGALADKVGHRVTLLTAITLYGVAGVSGFFVENLYGLLVSRLIVGLAAVAGATLALTYIATYADGTARSRWLGYFTAMSGLNGIVLTAFSGFIGKLGWHWPFLIHAFAFFVLLAVLYGIPRDRAAAPAHSAEKKRMALTDFPWKIAAFSAAVGALVVGYIVFSPFHLRDVGLSDPGRIGTSFAISSLATIITASSYGALRSRLSLDQAFFIGFFFCAIGHIVASTDTNYLVVMTGQTIIGAAAGILMANLFSYVAANCTPERSGLIIGVAKGSLVGGQFLGQMVLEPIVNRTHAGMALLLLGLFAAVFCLMYAKQLFTTRAPQATPV